jgi:hypothetical protein
MRSRFANRPRPLYIFDLDGTLALIEHRRHFVERDRDQQDWPAFFAACGDDVPNKPVIELFDSLRWRGCELWIFSGRSDEVRDLTIAWLLGHTNSTLRELGEGQLMMRRAGDYTPDFELKQQWIDAILPEDRARLVMAFDDREQVVQMWRANGICCAQVADGKF